MQSAWRSPASEEEQAGPAARWVPRGRRRTEARVHSHLPLEGEQRAGLVTRDDAIPVGRVPAGSASENGQPGGQVRETST